MASSATSSRVGGAPHPGGPRTGADINAGRTPGRQWAELLATAGQLHGRHRARSHGRRHFRSEQPEQACDSPTRPRRRQRSGCFRSSSHAFACQCVRPCSAIRATASASACASAVLTASTNSDITVRCPAARSALCLLACLRVRLPPNRARSRRNVLRPWRRPATTRAATSSTTGTTAARTPTSHAGRSARHERRLCLLASLLERFDEGHLEGFREPFREGFHEAMREGLRDGFRRPHVPAPTRLRECGCWRRRAASVHGRSASRSLPLATSMSAGSSDRFRPTRLAIFR